MVLNFRTCPKFLPFSNPERTSWSSTPELDTVIIQATPISYTFLVADWTLLQTLSPYLRRPTGLKFDFFDQYPYFQLWRRFWNAISTLSCLIICSPIMYSQLTSLAFVQVEIPSHRYLLLPTGGIWLWRNGTRLAVCFSILKRPLIAYPTRPYWIDSSLSIYPYIYSAGSQAIWGCGFNESFWVMPSHHGSQLNLVFPRVQF